MRLAAHSFKFICTYDSPPETEVRLENIDVFFHILQIRYTNRCTAIGAAQRRLCELHSLCCHSSRLIGFKMQSI